MTAIRLARGATGRDLLVKFAGHYHGSLRRASRGGGFRCRDAGAPRFGRCPCADRRADPGDRLQRPRGAGRGVRRARPAHRRGDRRGIGAANMGVVAPLPGFNRLIAETAHAHGALMILDEVLTGFRVHPAGVLGSAGGGGRGLSARHLHVRQGRRRRHAPGRARRSRRGHGPARTSRPVYQAGTLSGTRCRSLRAWRRCDSRPPRCTPRWMRHPPGVSAALDAALTSAGVTHAVARAGNLFSASFRAPEPRNYAEAQAQESFRYAPVLPLPAGAGRRSTAECLRGLVPHGRARRAGASAHRSGTPGCRRCRGCCAPLTPIPANRPREVATDGGNRQGSLRSCEQLPDNWQGRAGRLSAW